MWQKKFTDADLPRKQAVLEYMAHHPWNFYFVDGMPAEGETQKTEYAERRLKLDEIGSDICDLGLDFGWAGIDRYDYTSADHDVEQLLKGHPNRKIVPRIVLTPPLDWMRAHPEELCVYWKGPATAEAIRDMVGTPQHDRAGFEDGLISNQSFSSLVWLKDACEALSHFVEHFENSAYGSQFIGYHLAIGNCGECMWWGDWRNQGDPRRGDFGIHHKQYFFEWAQEKYGSPEALRKAWKMPDLTKDSLIIPTPPERWSENGKDLRGVLLADDQRQVDCNEFHSKVTFDAMETLAQVVFEMTGKPAGCFYGYLQDESVGYAGHLALDRAMTSKYLDFYSSPKAYHYCLAGDPGASQAPSQSFARKKLWIEENDSRSWLNTADICRAPGSWPETRTVFWRELYRALTFNYGFWWMDINGVRDDWYANENMVEMFKQQSAFFKKWSPVPRKSVAEVLFVEDGASCGHMTQCSGVQRNLRYRLERELRLAGVPVDHLLETDIPEVDMSRYKFIVFCHAFVMPKEKWDMLRKYIRPDATILWNWAAGILAPEFDPNNQKYVTGFNTPECPGRMLHEDQYRHMYWHIMHTCKQDYPLLEIAPQPGMEILQTSPDGHIITAKVKRDRGYNILAADFTLRTPILRRMIEEAGVRTWSSSHCAVLADEKLVGFFPRFDVSFSFFFEGTWRDVMTGETCTGAHQLSILSKEYRIFEKIQ